jgi:hypothetical protein
VEKLVELLHRHLPERAAEVRRRLAGPEPDGVLVLGPDDASVGRLAMALAARLPDRLTCAPVDAVPRERWVDRTRAVVWVFHASAPATERHWALLRDLAGAVDEVHLALAGAEVHRGWQAILDADRARLATAVPRLADRPVLPLADGPEELVVALRRSRSVAGTEDAHPTALRNAMRLLRTALADLLSGRETRGQHADLYRLSTERSLRRHREQVTARRSDAAAEWPKRIRVDLAQVRLAVSGEAADGLRRLREQVSDQLEHADAGARARFPEHLAAAAAALTDQVAARLDDALEQVEHALRRETGERSPACAPAWGAAPAPLAAVPARRRWEDRLVLVVGVSGGFGLCRFALTGGGAFPALFGAATLPLSVGLGVASAWWLARARRAMADRAVLARWGAEVLTDLRAGLDSMVSERVLAAQRRLVALVDRAAAVRAAELDSELREQELLARGLVASLVEYRELDAAALAELRGGCTELDRLLGAPAGSGAAPREVA